MDPGLRELIAGGAADDIVSVIVRLYPGKQAPNGLRLIATFGPISTARALRGMLEMLHDDPAVASLKAPRVYAGELGSRLDEIGVIEADPSPGETDRRRPADLAETGKGTVIAVIDWGIDFAHPDFRDARGRSRFHAIWDQRGHGHAPHYGYGRIHGRRAIDQALASADPFAALDYRPATGTAPAHGTHVMGIAAGNGRAGGPEGVAPEADLVFVHLGSGVADLGNSIDLLEAIDFAVKCAGDRPLAINMSIGRHAGPHDGTLLIEQAIDWLISNRHGTIVAQSTGNYFSRDVHMQGRLHETARDRLPFQIPQSSASPVTLEIWYQGADRFRAAVQPPGGARIEVELGAQGEVRDAAGKLLGRLYHREQDPNNQDNLIALMLHPHAPAGDWVVELEGLDVVDGRWHAWIERNTACPPCQAKFSSNRASGRTTTGSICNALRTIAVGAYDLHDPDHPLARFSSMGPTRDGRPKPLLVAPGVGVLSVRSRSDARMEPGYVRMSGTSMAAPHVTGVAALMLQAAGIQPVAAIRRTLFSTLAQPPSISGESHSARWGYGLLDVEAAVVAARKLPRLAPPHFNPSPAPESAVMPCPSCDPAAPIARDIAAPRSLLLTRALDPDDPGVQVIGWPGRRIRSEFAAGDIVVRQGLGSPVRTFVLTQAPAGSGQVEAEALDVEAVALSGGNDRVRLKLHGPDRVLPSELTVLRLASEDASSGIWESPPLPPPAARPTIRTGSRGPAVTDAQQRLNRIDARRSAQGQSRIERCPLTVDGIFGVNTRAATVSFQRLAFPAQPSEWDGIIGPRTWAQLDAWSYEQPIDPPPPPPTPIDPPIIPVADHPVDPTRWDALLRPMLSPDAQLRSGNAVRSFVDARETYEQMEIDINAANGERDYIYLLGWDMVDDFDMVPRNRLDGVHPNACPIGGNETGGGHSILGMLRAASDRRSVQVRVMLWAKPPLTGSLTVARINRFTNGKAIRDDETANNTAASTARLTAALAAALVSPSLIPVILSAIRPDLIRMTGAHHQKVLVVKRGETLVAYCGGLDINSNRLYSIDPAKGDPQHDTHCRIVGPSAWDLLDTFIRRWMHHPEGLRIETATGGGTEKLRGATEPVPAPVTTPNPADAMGLGTMSVAIARTFNPVHRRSVMRRERDIQRLLLRAIAAARRFIYIEDQYLFDYPDPRHPGTLTMAAALNAAVPNIQFLTILLPANHLAVPHVDGHYRRAFIDRVLSGLSATDRAKVGVFQLTSTPGTETIGCHCYVHSKSWVIDDELAVIGSANCNRRGYQHDSEVNAFIFDDAPSGGGGLIALAENGFDESWPLLRQTFAQRYRVRLWEEHLRVPKAGLMDGVLASPLWRLAARPPGARIVDFNFATSASQLTGAQAEALREFIDPVP